MQNSFDPQRAKGKEGQRFAESLFERVFTPFYYYSEPKDLLDRDQNEICDILVCWEDTIIICEVKNWKFEGDHAEYHKKTIEKAAKQIQGAERKLLSYPRDIMIDHPLYGKHRFPREKFSKVIRLVINLGEGEEFYPMRVETKRKDFISVLNKDTLGVMLNELDTPSDLLKYLHDREQLLRAATDHGRSRIVLSGREADLLSVYLKQDRQFDIELQDERFAAVYFSVDGNWDEFRSRSEVIARHSANRTSYFIDELVREEIVALHNGEPIVRSLMKFNRLERRILGDAFFEAQEKYSGFAVEGNTFRREMPFGEKMIVFLFYPSTFSIEIKAFSVELALRGIAMREHYSYKEILVIATTIEAEQFHFAYYNGITPFDAEMEERVEGAIRELGWFADLKKKEITTKEYPMGNPD